ncbi:MAG: methyltransferase domain-containing protein [Gemmatimonadetes bacterium]|nr:methyltransferase domain-containing protein [Gemmatimonadota bacterium]
MVLVTSGHRDMIFDAVRAMYTAVAREPERGFHFPTGRRACEYVGYPAAQLDALPEAAVESFAGVGYPFAADVVRPGDVVLDIGSGSGTDALIGSLLVGPAGRVIGLDMTGAMRAKLRANAALMGAVNVEVLDGNAEDVPLPDASVSVVTSNGVLNLVPDKPRAVAEIFRVLRPGGRVQIADIVVEMEPSAACRAQPQLWAECIVGATTKGDYLEMFRVAGFHEVEVLRELDYFAASSSEETRKVAGSFRAHAVVLRAIRGARIAEQSSRSPRPSAYPAADE